jgi:hypothetical protein
LSILRKFSQENENSKIALNLEGHTQQVIKNNLQSNQYERRVE